MHIKSIIHRLGVPTLQAGLWEAIFTQAFDLGYYVAPLQGLPGRQYHFVSLYGRSLKD